MMAKLLRYFSVISLVGLTAITIVLTWLHRQEGIAQLTRLTEHQHASIAQVVTQTWLSVDSLAAVERLLQRRLSAMPLTIVSAYDSFGERIFALGGPNLTVQNEPSAALTTLASISHRQSWLERDLQRVVSVIPWPNSVIDTDAKRDNRASLAPPAAIVLYSDVAPQIASIAVSETHFVKVLVAIFAVFYGVGVIVARRLSLILQRQEQSLLCNEKTLREKARQLEQAVSQRKQAEQALKAVNGKAELSVVSRTATPA